MADIGKYKARASTRKSFLDNQQSIQYGDLDRQQSAQDYTETQDLWSGVSKAVMDVGNILKEKKKASEFESFKDAAGNLEGIATKSEEYQPLGGIGAVLGLDPKVRSTYFDKESGVQLTDSVMHALGKKTMMGMETRYDKAPEGSFVHDSFKEYEGRIQGDESFKERMGDLKDVIGEKLSDVLSKAGLSKPDEAPKQELPGPESVQEPEYTGKYDDPSDAYKPKASGSVTHDLKGITEESLTDFDLPDMDLIEESLTDFSEQRDQNMTDDFGEAAEEMGLTKEQLLKDSKDMEVDSAAAKLAKKQMGILEKDSLGSEAAGDPEGSIVEALSEPDTFSLENASVDDVKKQIHSLYSDPKVAGEISLAMGMESSWGTDKDAKDNPLQIKAMKTEAEAAGVDISDMKQVSDFYLKKTSELTSDFGSYELQGDSQFVGNKGDKINVFQMMDSHGLDEKATRYIAWQQGRKGVLDIVTAAESGKMSRGRLTKMLDNLDSKQSAIIDNVIKSHGDYADFYDKPNVVRQVAKMFLGFQRDKMTSKGYTYKPIQNQAGVADSFMGGNLLVSQADYVSKNPQLFEGNEDQSFDPHKKPNYIGGGQNYIP